PRPPPARCRSSSCARWRRRFEGASRPKLEGAHAVNAPDPCHAREVPQEKFACALAFWAAAAAGVTRVTPAMRIGGSRMRLPFWPAAPHQPAGDIGRRNDAGWRLPAVGRALMPGRDTCLGWPAAIGAL